MDLLIGPPCHMHLPSYFLHQLLGRATKAGQLQWPADPDARVPAEMKAAATLAQELEMQWDMHLANTHTLQELQHLDFAQVRLPTEWFADWLTRLDELVPPTVSE